MAGNQEDGLTEKSGYSDWMSGLPDQLHNIHLWNLAIPGSHDTMTYDLDINSSIIEPDQLIPLSKCACEVTISKQLDAGVRFFDLRIAWKPNDPTRPFFYHGLYTQSDVKTVLKVINDWAERHPKEILILAFSHFKGIEKNVEQFHSDLINFIKNLFGAKLVKKLVPPTLQCCWESGRHVIVSYDYQPEQDDEIWSKIPYFYGNTMVPSEVKSTLDEKLRNWEDRNAFFVCGLNLTLPESVKAAKYICNCCDTLITVELRSLPELLEWVKKQTPGTSKTSVNIIASDVVDHDDFVPAVVKLNDKIL
ncbi:PI-PLC X domain-containing protein 1-like [Polymixia lowei]